MKVHAQKYELAVFTTLLWLLTAVRAYAQAEFMESTGKLASAIATSPTFVTLFGLALSGSILWLVVEKSMRALGGCFIVCLCGAGWTYGQDIMQSIMGH